MSRGSSRIEQLYRDGWECDRYPSGSRPTPAALTLSGGASLTCASDKKRRRDEHCDHRVKDHAHARIVLDQRTRTVVRCDTWGVPCGSELARAFCTAPLWVHAAIDGWRSVRGRPAVLTRTEFVAKYRFLAIFGALLPAYWAITAAPSLLFGRGSSCEISEVIHDANDASVRSLRESPVVLGSGLGAAHQGL